MKRVLMAIIAMMMASMSVNAQDIYYSSPQPAGCGCSSSSMSQSFPVQSMPMASQMGGNQVYYNSSAVESSYSPVSSYQSYPTSYPSTVGTIDYNQSVSYAQPGNYSSTVNYGTPVNSYPQSSGYSEVNYPSSVVTSTVPKSTYSESIPMTYATSNSNYTTSSEIPMTTAGTFTSNRISTPTTYSSPSYSTPTYSSPVNSYSSNASSYGGSGISATQKAQQAAQMSLKGHVGGSYCNGAKYEGVGWSTVSAQDAIQRCCYWGTRPVAQIGTCRGPDGWYACVMYY